MEWGGDGVGWKEVGWGGKELSDVAWRVWFVGRRRQGRIGVGWGGMGRDEDALGGMGRDG